jgi:hypothetical protein
VWMNAYNVQADQECMRMAMDDWWKSRSQTE